MATREELAEQVLLTVLGQERAQRESILAELCSHDPALKHMVEARLAEDEEMGNFLEHPPLEFFPRAMSDVATVTSGTDTPTRTHQGRLAAGQVLNDRFVIIRFIAKGGMGEVYEAEDKLLHGPHIALKTILPEEAGDPGLQHRFEQEVLSAREVVHPNLCPIYGIERSEEPAPEFMFLTMKLLPGETLAARLRRSGPAQRDEGVVIVRQMAAGLAAIHAEGIVHRDIKTNNVMVDGAGSRLRLWITDFGLARTLKAEVTVSGARIVVAGTPKYIAPELHKGQPPSPASDLYALGVVLHEVFTGEKPAAKADGSGVLPSQSLNSSEAPSSCIELIKGCLDNDPQKRCESFEQYMHGHHKLWTRRVFIATAAGAACSAAIGGWTERERLYDLWHPLPGKRFVALLNWPKTSDERVTPMLTGVLNAIKGELRRLEAYDRRLFVISPEDAHLEVKPEAHLKEVCDPLGANLALIAQGAPGVKYFELILRLLDPITNRIVRQREVKCPMTEVASLPVKAVEAAGKMLDLGQYVRGGEGTGPGTQSTAAFIAFQDAETLIKKPDDQGLEAAIEKYKDAVDIDPRYALAQAKLAIAYGRLYVIHREPSALDLARGNAERALQLNPNLVDGHLALALVFDLTGDEPRALSEISAALKLDPSHPKAMIWQGQIYTRLNLWSKAEEVFHKALQERPNYWIAYNELGLVLHDQGKYDEAIRAFRTASLAAPNSALPIGNLGGEYIEIGDFVEAKKSLDKSLALEPTDLGALNTSLVLRLQGRCAEALPFALKAVALNPADDANWMELGDCYSLLQRRAKAKDAYQQAMERAKEYLRSDPTNGPMWMAFALYQAEVGVLRNPLPLIQKAESLAAGDMYSQLYKATILELAGMRQDALDVLAKCLQRGAKDSVQISRFPDLQTLRKDPRYTKLIQSGGVTDMSSITRPAQLREVFGEV